MHCSSQSSKVAISDAPVNARATDPRVEASSRSVPERLVRRIAPFAVLLTAVTAMTGNLVDPDLWGHVQYGRELLRDGAVPATTTWSYVAKGQRWINHENLSEVLLAWGAAGGVAGLTLGKLVLGGLLIGCLMLSARRQGAGWLATALVVVAAAASMEFHWHFRPQAITYLSFAAMVALLDWVFHDWSGTWRTWRTALRGTPQDVPAAVVRRLDWLLLLVPLFVLWTNSHGGFAAGVAVLFAYLGGRAVEAWAWWGRAAGGVLFKLAGIGVLVALATLLNPYGAELHAWMLYDVFPPRPEIADWRPLDLFHDPKVCAVWLLLALAAIGLTLSPRRKDMTKLVILGLILWQGLAHCRHIVFFAILCGCWLGPLVQDVLDRITRDWRDAAANRGTPTRPLPIGWWGVTAVCVWLVGLAATLLPRISDLPVRRDWYPVAAMQYVADRGLTGRFLVDLNWAQYAIMCFAHDPHATETSRVAVDGRLRTCYAWETLDVYFDYFMGAGGPELRNRSVKSPPFQSDRALEIGPPDLILVWREQKHSARVVADHADAWVLLYQDQIAQLWGRRDRYDDPESAVYIAPADRCLGDTPQVGAVTWPALPVVRESAVPQVATR